MRARNDRAFKSAVVTGATSGIGAAFARALPAACDLLLTGRDGVRLAALRDELATPGRRIETLAADLTLPADLDRLVVASRAAAPDLLINNAGFGAFGRAMENAPEDEAGMVQVNVLAPVVLTRALLPEMLGRAEAGGRPAGVIIVASIAGFTPLPWFATYAATKAFDLHYAEALAEELAGRPAAVLALCPGSTDTEFWPRAGGVSPSPWAMASPDRVAREGLAMLGRRTVHVVGGGNQLMSIATRMVPRALARRGAGRAMQRAARRGRP